MQDFVSLDPKFTVFSAKTLPLHASDCTSSNDPAQSTSSYQAQQANGKRCVLARALCRFPASLCCVCGLLAALSFFFLSRCFRSAFFTYLLFMIMFSRSFGFAFFIYTLVTQVMRCYTPEPSHSYYYSV